MAAAAGMKTVSFEVFGKVQGVFFRKHTETQAKKLGLTGWVKNTEAGTVTGCIEGPDDKLSMMKIWLQETGSPRSRIEKCVFKDEKRISSKTFSGFHVKK